MTTTAALRNAALRRSVIREVANDWLGEEASQYDMRALITELSNTIDLLGEIHDLTTEEFWTIAKRHELPLVG